MRGAPVYRVAELIPLSQGGGLLRILQHMIRVRITAQLDGDETGPREVQTEGLELPDGWAVSA